MIGDLDRTIERLLRRELPPELSAQVSVSFAAPDSDFPPGDVTLPAVDVFLYDVRENLELRSAEWQVEREGGRVRRHSPLVRIDCSYLITAWASEASMKRMRDEHRMLGEVMRALLRHRTIPPALLEGELVGSEPRLPTAALHAGPLQSIGEFWQALNGKPKAAVGYTVTIAVEPSAPTDLGPPVVDARTWMERR